MTAFLITIMSIHGLAAIANLSALGYSVSDRPKTDAFHLVMSLGLSIWAGFLLFS